MTENQKRRIEDRLPGQPLQWDEESANDEILALHRQLAAEKLRADQGWERAEAKSHECIELRERMASVPPLTAPAPLTDELRPTDDHLWDQTMRERDHNAEMADKLAEAIAKHFDAHIGEHSNMNCPWAEALEVIEGYEDEKPLHFAALLPGPYYMDPPDGGSVSVLEQFRRMAEDAAQWRAHVAKANNPVACEHCGAHLPLHLLTCPVAVNGMAEGKKKEAPEPLRQLLIDLSNNTYFCGLHLSDETKYAGYLAAAEKAEQSLIELFEQATAEPDPQQGEFVSIEPTYYVRHPDNSYSVADPQPPSKAALVDKPQDLTIREAFEEVGGWMNGGEMGYPSFGSFEALSVYTTKMIRSYLANKECRESAAPVQADQAQAAEVRAQALDTSSVLDTLWQRVTEAREAAYTFGDTCKEAVEIALDGVLDMLVQADLAQSSTADKASEVRAALEQEVAQLKQRLEKNHKALFITSQALHNQIVGNQSAWIEWQHGEGAEAAMTWIHNGLVGPGLIPDEGEPNGKKPQEWFNEHQDDRYDIPPMKEVGTADSGNSGALGEKGGV